MENKPIRKCIDCGKRIANYYAKRCKSCARKNVILRNPEVAINMRYPKGYWLKKKRSSQTKLKISQSNKGLHHSPKTEFKKGHKRSVKTLLLQSKTMKGLWKKDSYRKKLSKERQERWNNLKYKNNWLRKMLKSSNANPNKPEKLLDKLLSQSLPKKFQFVGDGKLIIGGFNPDFVNKANTKIIEMYGDYWHNLATAKKRDKRRLRTYKKHGYKILIVWEHELKNLDKVKEIILKFDKEK